MAKTIMLWTVVLVLGILPSYITLAGYQCSVQFQKRGFCINRNSYCPAGSSEFVKLSNGLGCPALNQRCCVGGVSNPSNPSNPDTSRDTCGKDTLPVASRILNGVKAGPCDWPFVVSIRAKLRMSSSLDYQSSSHICAGVLIDKSWVLTSAICVINAGETVALAQSRFLVVAGEYNISGIDIDPLTRRQQEQVINVQQVIIHPGYAYSNLNQIDLNQPNLVNGHGVALIKLAQPIVGRCSGVICLPTLEEAQDDCASYKDCVITGWGYPSESFSPPKGALDLLKQGRVKLTSQKGCNIAVSRLGLEKTRPAGSICQMPDDYYLTNGCPGDEGGAVMCSTGTNWVVRGILPFQLCSKGNYDLFVTDVAQHLQWIKNTMSKYRTYG